MSGYPYGGNPPQYPPPQNHIYPQLYNPAKAAPPGNPASLSYPTAPGQNPQYPYQPAFAYQGTQAGVPGQPSAGMEYSGIAPTQTGYPGIAPTQTGYPGIAPTPTQPYGFGYVAGAPQPSYGPPVEWVRTTPQAAHTLSDRALVAGYEGHDHSPLWIIRARFEGDLIPGKLAVKHLSAYVPWGGAEHAVNDIEVCCARPERVRWLESSNGHVPPNAIPGGRTAFDDPIYICRAKEQGSLTPGKIHPGHTAVYISFAGKEVAHKTYEVLCQA